MTENPPNPDTPPGGSVPPPANPYGATPPAAGNPYGAPPPASQPPVQNPYGGPSVEPQAGAYGSTAFPTSGQPETPYVGPEQPGGLGARVGARLIDMIGLFIIQMVLAGVIVAAMGGLDEDNKVPFAATLITTVLGLAINFAYFVLMETSRGQTLGKMALSLHVRGPGGANPTTAESVKRNIWMLIGVVGLLGGNLGQTLNGLLGLAVLISIMVTIGSDAVRRQGWHDKFADTHVVKKS